MSTSSQADNLGFATTTRGEVAQAKRRAKESLTRDFNAWIEKKRGEWELTDTHLVTWGEHAIDPTLKMLSPLLQKYSDDTELRILYAKLLSRKGNALRDDSSRMREREEVLGNAVRELVELVDNPATGDQELMLLRELCKASGYWVYSIRDQGDICLPLVHQLVDYIIAHHREIDTENRKRWEDFQRNLPALPQPIGPLVGPTGRHFVQRPFVHVKRTKEARALPPPVVYAAPVVGYAAGAAAAALPAALVPVAGAAAAALPAALAPPAGGAAAGALVPVAAGAAGGTLVPAAGAAASALIPGAAANPAAAAAPASAVASAVASAAASAAAASSAAASAAAAASSSSAAPAPAAPAIALADEVMAYLQRRRLEGFAQGLADFGVECLHDLDEMTDADLTGMGFKELHRRRIHDKSYGNQE